MLEVDILFSTKYKNEKEKIPIRKLKYRSQTKRHFGTAWL